MAPKRKLTLAEQLEELRAQVRRQDAEPKKKNQELAEVRAKKSSKQKLMGKIYLSGGVKGHQWGGSGAAKGVDGGVSGAAKGVNGGVSEASRRRQCNCDGCQSNCVTGVNVTWGVNWRVVAAMVKILY
ncbi:hypothetical protein B0H13DRAFT_1901265 [Mycena leptocephala]|nr:hypothetical protein B0H13DRAFT_1901265 [Mycena leptocephala]